MIEKRVLTMVTLILLSGFLAGCAGDDGGDVEEAGGDVDVGDGGETPTGNGSADADAQSGSDGTDPAATGSGSESGDSGTSDGETGSDSSGENTTDSGSRDPEEGTSVDFSTGPAYYVHKSEYGDPQPTVIGIVKNTGSTTIAPPEIAVTFYDENDNVVGTGSALPSWGLEPGDEFPFYVQPMDVPAEDVARFEASVSAEEAFAFDPANAWLTVQGDQGKKETGEHAFASYKVLGEVKNSGDGTANGVEVAAMTFDADGNPLEVWTTTTDPMDIPAGSTGSFELQFTRTDVDVADYRVFASAHKGT